MIALCGADGHLIRALPEGTGTFGFHSALGWVSEGSSKGRLRSRTLHGLKSKADWICRFQLKRDQTKGQVSIQSLENCTVSDRGAKSWALSTPLGDFVLNSGTEAVFDPFRLSSSETRSEEENKRDRSFWLSLLGIGLITALFVTFFPLHQPLEEEEPLVEPVTVKLAPRPRQMVRIPKILPNLKVAPQKADATRRAIQQNLGFLGLLGNKNLKKAIGGAPTQLKDASPGAGAGGKEGSGGELLVGIGRGVKRTTVGNTGSAGLGGIGTKGRGGGQGGYGNASVGSGEGSRLSAMGLSDDIVLEGGLDRAVIQATIAKYLNQVRACYERGLRQKPGIAGQVTMAFAIGATGKLQYSKVSKSSLGYQPVEGCISDRMMTWQFPKPLGGVVVKVKYPFLLRPVGT